MHALLLEDASSKICDVMTHSSKMDKILKHGILFYIYKAEKYIKSIVNTKSYRMNFSTDY